MSKQNIICNKCKCEISTIYFTKNQALRYEYSHNKQRNLVVMSLVWNFLSLVVLLYLLFVK